ncbi:hypothetical protein N9112_01705 [bacterium]|jgi:hypothetical protein|nr:hypothetical protein [bacterium]
MFLGRLLRHGDGSIFILAVFYMLVFYWKEGDAAEAIYTGGV